MADLLTDSDLERSEIVANNLMNRERGIVGPNSYAKDLHFDPLQFLYNRLDISADVAWLDLCCGTGRALIEAAGDFEEKGVADRVTVVGVDLIPGFLPFPEEWRCLHFEAASLPQWKSQIKFDLITCVHGIHYVGDKLDTLRVAAASLKPDGLLLAHLDLSNLKLSDARGQERPVKRFLTEAGFDYDTRRQILKRDGRCDILFPCRYLGADDTAGPNSTGQPAVDSHYQCA